MIGNWLEFEISLPDFLQFLKDNIPKADGIYATSDQWEVIELEPFNDDDRAAINSYLDNLEP